MRERTVACPQFRTPFDLFAKAEPSHSTISAVPCMLPFIVVAAIDCEHATQKSLPKEDTARGSGGA